MLDDVRVLEVSAPETMLAGRILADLGADVVVVEPPAGSAGRRLAPFLDDNPGIERSLTWHALNNNKRGVTIDLSSSDGKALMRDLAAKFDVVIDAAGAQRMSPLDSIEFAPRTIRCTITPFARSGPKSDYAATDFTVMAASGAPAMTGDLDRPPLFFPVPQAMLEAGADAAIATLAALLARDRDGVGQRAEVSARIAAMMGSFGQALVPGSGNPEGKRTQGAMTIAGVQVPSVYQCADCFTLITIGFGPVFGQMTQRLAKWAAEEGRMDQRIADISWPTFVSDLSARKASPSDLQALVDGLKSLARSKTKAEMAESSRKLGLLSSPVMNMKDVAEYVQYRERGLFTRVKLDGGREIDAPARFAQFSNYSIEIKRPAPKLSEHSVEIFGTELGLSKTEVQALFVAGEI
ncbi:CoA transferase [Candidatus Binatus sp.]|uniref:CoA transferase n=1 Tax=Candidatus Binatus sp. TaxID=2811406 RepID=UPI003C796626